MPLTFYRCVSFKHRQMYSFYRMMGRGREEDRWERKIKEDKGRRGDRSEGGKWRGRRRGRTEEEKRIV